jgi:membrane associated rhomboid family serine protease
MTPTSPDSGLGAPAFLTAGSRREAMDWGLVLISQGIPAVIERVQPDEPSDPPVSCDPVDLAEPDLSGPAGASESCEVALSDDGTPPPPSPPPIGPMRPSGRRPSCRPRHRARVPRRRPESSRTVIWHLRVEPHLIDRARAVIEAYRLEDRRFDWARGAGAGTAMGTGAFSWSSGALVWAAVVCALHGLLPPALRSLGWIEVAAVRQQGQWWRLWTATWLHADVAHLVSNVATGGLTLGLAMGRHGPGTALCLSLLAGVLANLPGLFLRESASRALGASGVVMATLGLLAGHAVVWWRLSRHASRPVGISLGAAGFLFLSLGVDPSSDVLAHLGGFFAGIVLGAVAAWFRWGRFDKVWAWAYVVLALGPWAWAMVSAPR